MSAIEKKIKDQIKENYERAFNKDRSDPEIYNEKLNKFLDSLDKNESFPATATLTVTSDGKFKVAADLLDGKHQFSGSASPNASDPEGGESQGKVVVSQPTLFTDTSQFNWINGSIFTIFFLDSSGNKLGLLYGPYIENLNPSLAPGPGSWN